VIKTFFSRLLDFIIPPICVVCESPLGSNSFLCGDCRKKLVRYNNTHPWQTQYITNGYLNNSFSLYEFVKDSPIQHLLHSMKYEKMKSIGTMLGKEIGAVIPDNIHFDYAVPVPLHLAKERERTYNQSDYICRGIAEITGSKALPRLLKRTRFTKSQTKLDKLQRIENVKGVFEINPKYKNLIAGKNIILVDDVITTGSTILECARVLKENNAGYVTVCSAAYDAIPDQSEGSFKNTES